MNKLAMRFAVVRFMPYVQTREFANIGIILTCPKTGFFDYKIEQKYSRLSNFFQHFNGRVYRTATASFINELNRIKANLYAQHPQPEILRATLDHLARPREAIILTSEVGITTAVTEADELTRLFDYFVGHSFAKDAYEETMNKAIHAVIRDLQTVHPFFKEKLGNDEYHANLPFVQRGDNETVRKIIKPIYLGHDEASGIYQKSDSWLQKLKRLRNFGFIDSNTEILFPFEPPKRPNQAQSNAFSAVLADIKQSGIQPVYKDETAKIAAFASN